MENDTKSIAENSKIPVGEFKKSYQEFRQEKRAENVAIEKILSQNDYSRHL